MQYKLFFILLTLALICSAVSAEEDAVKLVVGGQAIYLHTPPILVDEAVYVPLAALDTVGAKTKTDTKHKQDGQKVEITPMDGNKFTCRARLINDQIMLPMYEIAPKLGVETNWDEAAKTLSLRAQIKQIEFDGSKLQVYTSYPVAYDASWWKAKNRLILHLHGVQIPIKAADLPVKNSTNISIRSGSNGEVGTIVLDLSSAVEYKMESGPKSAKVSISIKGFKPFSESSDLSPAGRAAEPDPVAETPTITEQPELPPADITGVDYQKQGPRRLDIYIAASRPVKYTTYLFRQPDRLIADFYKARLSKEIEDIAVGHQILQGIRVSQRDKNTVRVTMDLTRVVGFDIRQDKGSNRVTISLELPKGAGGSLSQKTIVIDPGHGGPDSGAVGCGGWREEESNLAIGLRVQKLLSDAGACALMTRKEDVAVDVVKKRDLEKRAEFAANHSADFFISIHSNSIRVPGSMSGIETYYHGHDMSANALAQCIHTEVIKAAGLPDLRVKSDFVLYQTGLGVLRNASERFGIPAALMEIGFVNHPYDSTKIKDPDFQQKVAEAIVRGLKAYVEGNPTFSERQNEPEVIIRGSLPKPDDTLTTTGPQRPGDMK